MTVNHTNVIYSIVLIQYPFDDLVDYKIRPVLILSYPITKHNHLVTAFITSKTPEPMEKSDVFLSAEEESFQLTGLKQNSIIRLHRLFTVPHESVLKQLGELPAVFHRQIIEKLKFIFNMNK